jgi:hypothetical protein
VGLNKLPATANAETTKPPTKNRAMVSVKTQPLYLEFNGSISVTS